MPDAVGFEAPAEVLAFALKMVKIEGHYLEFGVFAGGTIRFIARRIGDRIIHGFDSFQGLPEDWSGYNLGQRAFDTQGRLPRVPDNVRLHPGWLEAFRRGLSLTQGPLHSFTSTVTSTARRRRYSCFWQSGSCRAPSFSSTNILTIPIGSSTSSRRFRNLSLTAPSSIATLDFRASRWPCGSKQSVRAVLDHANPIAIALPGYDRRA